MRRAAPWSWPDAPGERRGWPTVCLKRVRDFAQVKYDGVITEEVAKFALDLLEVDKYGLDHIDRNILLTHH